MKNTTIAIDLAKSVFEVGISDRPGHVSRNCRLARSELSSFLATQPPATVVMEACSSSHYWGTEIRETRSCSEIASATLCASLGSAFQDR